MESSVNWEAKVLLHGNADWHFGWMLRLACGLIFPICRRDMGQVISRVRKMKKKEKTITLKFTKVGA